MSRSLSCRTLRRLKQADRNLIGPRSGRIIRIIRARTVDVQDDDLSQRKRIEKLWEQSINFFADSGDINTQPKGDPDGTP